MHTGEMWQDYSLAGVPLKNGGYDSSLGNPDLASNILVGSANVWFYRVTDDGNIEVLFQHRSELVDRNPGKWDLSAAGHMNYGENILEAAIRETREEIGAEITENDLRFVCSFTGMSGKNMLNHHLLCNWTGKEDDFHFDDQEVSEVAWVPFTEFDQFIDENCKDAVRDNIFARNSIKFWLEKMSGNLKLKER